MELFVPSFEGERKRSTRPAMRVLTAGTARAYIHDLLPPRPLSGRPVTPDTPFILLILRLSNPVARHRRKSTALRPDEPTPADASSKEWAVIMGVLFNLVFSKDR